MHYKSLCYFVEDGWLIITGDRKSASDEPQSVTCHIESRCQSAWRPLVQLNHTASVPPHLIHSVMITSAEESRI